MVSYHNKVSRIRHKLFGGNDTVKLQQKNRDGTDRTASTLEGSFSVPSTIETCIAQDQEDFSELSGFSDLSGEKPDPSQCNIEQRQPVATTRNNEKPFSGIMHRLLTERLHSESPKNVVKALKRIVALLNKGGGVAASDAFELQAASTILSCMAHWQDNEEIQDWALLSLLGIVVFVSSEEEARLSILKDGVVQAIVNSMKLFPFARNIQRVGCLVLVAVFGDTSTLSSVANNVASNLVMEWGGVDVVLKIMKKWSNDAAMQATAIRLLCSLWLLEGARSQMMDKGAEIRIAAALAKFPNDNVIKKQALRFFDVSM